MSPASYWDQSHAHFSALARSSGNQAGWRRAGWSSAQSEETRFRAILSTTDFGGLDVIDVGGCIGGLAIMARNEGIVLRSYVNVEAILDNCIHTQQHGLLSVNGSHRCLAPGAADMVIASGLLNFSLPDWVDAMLELTACLVAATRRYVLITLRPRGPDYSDVGHVVSALTPGEITIRDDYRKGETLILADVRERVSE